MSLASCLWREMHTALDRYVLLKHNPMSIASCLWREVHAALDRYTFF